MPGETKYEGCKCAFSPEQVRHIEEKIGELRIFIQQRFSDRDALHNQRAAESEKAVKKAEELVREETKKSSENVNKDMQWLREQVQLVISRMDKSEASKSGVTASWVSLDRVVVIIIAMAALAVSLLRH